MRLGKIIGNVVATRKSESLVGLKLMLVYPINEQLKPYGETIIAVDTVGAGIGDIIIYAVNTASRNAAGRKDAAIDTAIIGIVDNIECNR